MSMTWLMKSMKQSFVAATKTADYMFIMTGEKMNSTQILGIIGAAAILILIPVGFAIYNAYLDRELKKYELLLKEKKYYDKEKGI